MLTKHVNYGIIFPEIANMGHSIEKRIKAVEAYNKNRKIHAVARKYSINAATLWRWNKWYQCLGKKDLGSVNTRKELEIEIMMLKEKKPDLTLQQAKTLLTSKKISIKRIYNIWKKYGLIARSPAAPFAAYGPLTAESTKTLAQVKLILKENGNEKNLSIAGKLLSELPSFPDNHESILTQIPDKYLSWRRRLDKLDAEFATTPKPVLHKKIKKIRHHLQKQGLHYSALLAGVFEILIMHWMRMPKDEIKLNLELQKQKGKLREPVLNLALSFLAGTAYTEMLDVKNSYRYVRRLQKLQRSLPYVQTYTLIGDLLTFITDYKNAIVFYKKAFSCKHSKPMNINLRLKISLALAIAGDYRTVEGSYLKNIGIKPDSHNYDTFSLIKALCAFGQGKIDKARNWLQQCLERSKREQLRNYIYTANSCLASISCALGRPKDARKILKKVRHLQLKYRLQRAVKVMDIVLGSMHISEKYDQIPTLCILKKLSRAQQSLKSADYYSAFQYARKKGQTGFFHRMIVFFPESVLALLKKGKPTNIPNSILRLPIFNKAAPVFHIKYLGNTVIYRNHKYIRVKLNPQEESLFIQIAQRAGEPGKIINLREIIDNYWQKSRNPANRLAHVLVQLRKKLNIPKHTLCTVRHSNASRICNMGFFVTTDYNDFTINLIQARAFENLNEWPSAKNKYREAFCMIRGAPFRNIYDNWADSQRHIILSMIEHQMSLYINSSRLHKNESEAIFLQKRLDSILHG
ncbi:hypothetical protein A2Y85_07445 [candidate division WOR-3 bacterium RBG_13_43_14]|uniref:Uncharacterized protein n=1 Tax=candidate division WOR-3 bacterium RBG_13_43_14 TaxID=1802590 RepID=A0A1F4UBV1_UNCW3|nr:MAG: hypothetical protein A2Y85_07445 [candidate division WOR-3 bacterium RBG_13_43_14]